MIYCGRIMKKVKYIGSIIIKLGILFAIFCVLSLIFENKDLGTTQYNFAHLEKNSVDVVAVGSSHLYCSFHAPLLKEEYGMESYVLGTSAQTMALTYYGVKEAIESQHPDVIVVELFYCFYDRELVQDAYTHDFFDEMPLGSAKIEGIHNIIESDSRVAYWIPFTVYHSRWKELQRKDFANLENDSRGFWASDVIMPYERIDILPESDMQEIPQINQKYLDWIISLCEENDITLLCYGAPFYDMEDVKDVDIESVQRYYNWLDAYLEERGVEFVNFFHLLDEIQFDYGTDLKDYGHCNTSGATKITRYLAENYLAEMLSE